MHQTMLFAVPQSRWTLKLAKSIAGSLGNPSKMPGKSYGISAKLCNIGQKLATVPGSVCFGCYAMKDNYNYPSVKVAHERRAAGLSSVSWRDAMVTLIRRSDDKFFRWHDSGDLQSFQHLLDIVAIADKLPQVNFWLPTKEKKLILQYRETFGDFPANLVVRISGAMVDGKPLAYDGNTSTVHSTVFFHGFKCRAPEQDGKCLDCRACWNKEIKNVSYEIH
jgi:hypothetical protein